MTTSMQNALFERLTQRYPNKPRGELAHLATWWTARGWLTTEDLRILFDIKVSTSVKWCNMGWLKAQKRGRSWAVSIKDALEFVPPKRRGRYS